MQGQRDIGRKTEIYLNKERKTNRQKDRPIDRKTDEQIEG